MKKIIISKDSLLNNQDLIKENINADLTSFIMDKVMTNQTSLSHCVALPRQDGVPFEYGLLQKRFSEVKNNLFQFSHIASTSEQYLITVLSRMIVRCQELEKPIQNNLIKICENIVIDLFDIPSETINLSCKLVGKIEPKQGSINLLPENEGNIENYDYSNLLKFGDLTKQVLKRRLINSLIQGGAYSLGTMFELYGIDNEELIDLYKRIIAINDFILFTVKEKVSDKYPKQGAYVEVLLGREGEKTEINAQGIIFPLLLIETIRGLLELFASHGLPKDNSMAKEVISHSDFLLAEPWDLRLGVPLWQILTRNLETPKVLPYYFTNICKMHNKEFNETLREIFSESIEGKKLRGKLMNVAENQFEYQQFVDKMQQKNADIAVITDGNMSIEDLDKLELSENDTIEETTWNFHYGKDHDGKPYKSENKYVCYHETGQFGSGTYFSTYQGSYETRDTEKYIQKDKNPQFIQVDNGVYRVDIDLYKNLYRVYNEKQGNVLHTLLGDLNAFYHKVSGFGLGHYYPNQADYNNSQLYQRITFNTKALHLNCPDYLHLTRMAQEHAKKGEGAPQSFSTVFMEYNGYNGVNVSGVDKFDNSRHGSVIYDLNKCGDQFQKIDTPTPNIWSAIDGSHTNTIAYDLLNNHERTMAKSLTGELIGYEFNELSEQEQMLVIKNIIAQSRKRFGRFLEPHEIKYYLKDKPRILNYLFKSMFKGDVPSEFVEDYQMRDLIIELGLTYFINYNSQHYSFLEGFLHKYLMDNLYEDNITQEDLDNYLNQLLSHLKRPLTTDEKEYIDNDYNLD